MSISVPFVSLANATAALKTDLLAATERVLDRGIFIMGDELTGFEAEFAAYCTARHAVGVGNGLDALTLSLRAMGIGPGDEGHLRALVVHRFPHDLGDLLGRGVVVDVRVDHGQGAFGQ